ncbi:MAG: DnaA/Hda family protein [Gemmataceae bacterium]|nr:DnaA/Hda family protein [Gemmataceae bacterium]
MTWSGFVPTPENRSAWLAVRQLAAGLRSAKPRPTVPSLFLHGPTGTGKTHLVNALTNDLRQHAPNRVALLFSAGELSRVARQKPETWTLAADADLLAVEDLQHLTGSAAQTLAFVFDQRLSEQRPMVFTANVGPRQLKSVPTRLVSRLAGGLVIGLAPLGPESRNLILRREAKLRRLAVDDDVLAWLAKELTGSGRYLRGVIARLVGISRNRKGTLRLEDVQRQLGEEIQASRPTVERIAQRVGQHFHVGVRQLQSRRRTRHILLPRQIGMYLARQLTSLSLSEIGDWFGGRDHTTVLSACRRVESSLRTNPELASAVESLQAEFR